MDAATINARIYAGRGKAAQRIGYTYYVKRPMSATPPFMNVLALPVAFNAGDSTYKKANSFNNVTWYADCDASALQVGDYLSSVGAFRYDAFPHGTNIYFVAGKQSLLPILVVACNRSIRITKPVQSGGPVGALGYSGSCNAPGEFVDVLGSAALNLGWPAAIIFGLGAARVDTPLPTGTKKDVGWWIYLPVSVPVLLSAGMHLVDDQARTFVIDGAELSDLGWRLQATEVHS